MSEEKKDYIELPEAAKKMHVSVKTLRALIKKKAVGYYRPMSHGKYFFSDEHISQFRQSRSFSPAENV